MQVTVQPVQATLASPEQFLERLRAIWTARQTGGPATDSAQAIELQRHSMREEMEQEIQEAMRLQQECRQARQAQEPAG